MAKHRTLHVTVRGKDEIERFILILNIGFMTTILEGLISAEESQYRFYSPYTVEQLKKRCVNEEIIDLHRKALELEDVKKLVSVEQYESDVKSIKMKSMEILRRLPIQVAPGYRHWVQNDRNEDMHIRVSREERQVIINGVHIGGFVGEVCCPVCGKKQVYYDKYDAFFCPGCNQWVSSTCDDDECSFCRNRPKRPL